MRRGPRVARDYESYLRRTLYNLAVDGWRARSRRPECPVTVEPAVPDRTSEVDLRSVLVQALAQLPPSQRATLVLRYWEEMTEADAAKALGCSVGTVKSATSRGIQRLREITAAWDGFDMELAAESPLGSR